MSTIIQDFADYHVAIIQVLRAEEDGGSADGDGDELDGDGASSSSPNANPHSSWVRELRLKALSVLTAKDVELYGVENAPAEGGNGGGASSSRPSTAGASSNAQSPSIPFLITALSPWTTVTGVVSNLVYGTGGQAKNLLMEAARRGREDIVSGLLNEDGMVEVNTESCHLRGGSTDARAPAHHTSHFTLHASSCVTTDHANLLLLGWFGA